MTDAAKPNISSVDKVMYATETAMRHPDHKVPGCGWCAAKVLAVAYYDAAEMRDKLEIALRSFAHGVGANG